ncbi:hypothetical protein KY331_04055 [Candidatus Woesearchaeota archaeon]|nr:hypothetical protein [Candidatus Woesearchaeota archaeon]
MGEDSSKNSSEDLIATLAGYRNDAIIQSITADTSEAGKLIISDYRELVGGLLADVTDEDVKKYGGEVTRTLTDMFEQLSGARAVLERVKQIRGEYEKEGNSKQAAEALSSVRGRAKSPIFYLYHEMLDVSIRKAEKAIGSGLEEAAAGGTYDEQPPEKKIDFKTVYDSAVQESFAAKTVEEGKNKLESYKSQIKGEDPLDESNRKCIERVSGALEIAIDFRDKANAIRERVESGAMCSPDDISELDALESRADIPADYMDLLKQHIAGVRTAVQAYIESAVEAHDESAANAGEGSGSLDENVGADYKPKKARSLSELKSDLDGLLAEAGEGELTDKQKIRLNELEYEAEQLPIYENVLIEIRGKKTERGLDLLDQRAIGYRKQVADDLAKRVVENLKDTYPDINQNQVSRWLIEEFDSELKMTEHPYETYRHKLTDASAKVYGNFTKDKEGFLERHGHVGKKVEKPAAEDAPAPELKIESPEDLRQKLKQYGESLEADGDGIENLHNIQDGIDILRASCRGNSELMQIISEDPVPKKVNYLIRVHEEGGEPEGYKPKKDGDGKPDSGGDDTVEPDITTVGADDRKKVIDAYAKTLGKQREKRGTVIPGTDTDDALTACDREDAGLVYREGERLGLKLPIEETPYMKLRRKIDELGNQVMLSSEPEALKGLESELVSLKKEARSDTYSKEDQVKLLDLIEKGSGSAKRKQEGLLEKEKLEEVIDEIYLRILQKDPYFTGKREVTVAVLEEKANDQSVVKLGIIDEEGKKKITYYDSDRLIKHYIVEGQLVGDHIKDLKEKVDERFKGEEGRREKENALEERINEQLEGLPKEKPSLNYRYVKDAFEKLKKVNDDTKKRFRVEPSSEFDEEIISRLQSLEKEVENRKKSTQRIRVPGVKSETAEEAEEIEVGIKWERFGDLLKEVGINCYTYLGFKDISEFVEWENTPGGAKGREAEDALLDILFKDSNRELVSGLIERNVEKESIYRRIGKIADENGFRCPGKFYKTPEEARILSQLSALKRGLQQADDERVREIVNTLMQYDEQHLEKLGNVRYSYGTLARVARQAIELDNKIKDDDEFNRTLDAVVGEGIKDLDFFLEKDPHLKRLTGEFKAALNGLKDSRLRKKKEKRRLKKGLLVAGAYGILATIAAVYFGIFAKPEKEVEIVGPAGPRVAALQTQVIGLQKKLDEEKAAKEAAKERFSQLNENVDAEVNKRTAGAQKRNAELGDKVNSLQGKLDDVNSLLVKERAAYQTEKGKYDATIAGLRDQVTVTTSILRKERQADQQEDAEHKKQLAELAAKEAALKKALIARETAEQKNRLVIIALRVEQARLKQEIERMKKQIPADLNDDAEEFLRGRSRRMDPDAEEFLKGRSKK